MVFCFILKVKVAYLSTEMWPLLWTHPLRNEHAHCKSQTHPEQTGVRCFAQGNITHYLSVTSPTLQIYIKWSKFKEATDYSDHIESTSNPQHMCDPGPQNHCYLCTWFMHHFWLHFTKSTLGEEKQYTPKYVQNVKKTNSQILYINIYLRMMWIRWN